MNERGNLNIVDSLADPVGELWRDLQASYTENGSFNVAAPLSSTPLPIYDWIVANKDQFANWDKVNFVLMDEMVEGENPPYSYIDLEDSASYEKFARVHFLDPLGESIPVLKPELQDIENGPMVDLLILALGVKGNYANVMPDTPLESGWHIAHLIPEFRQAHTSTDSSSYAGASFREYGMSLGPQQVLNAEHVVVIVSGSKKRELAEELLSYDSFDPIFPLSIIHHPEIRDRVQVFFTGDVL